MRALTKKDREALNRIKILRKQQLEQLEILIFPIKEDLRLLDLTLKNKFELEAYINHAVQIMKYLKKL